jgi:hypothetical protein
MLGLRPVALLPCVTAFGLQALAVATMLGGCATTPLSLAAGVGGPSASEATGSTQHVQLVRGLREDPAQPLGLHPAAWPGTPTQPSAADADAIIAAAITAHEMRKP